jgi:hypothetical protein
VHGSTSRGSKSLKRQAPATSLQHGAGTSYFLRRWSRSTGFIIGKNRCGHWVVLDREGLCGGLFASEKAARAYALYENGNQEEALRFVPHLELTFHRRRNRRELANSDHQGVARMGRDARYGGESSGMRKSRLA